MKAILHGDLYTVLEDTGDGLLLIDNEDDSRVEVSFGNPGLIVDPTDDQVDAARNLAAARLARCVTEPVADTTKPWLRHCVTHNVPASLAHHFEVTDDYTD